MCPCATWSAWSLCKATDCSMGNEGMRTRTRTVSPCATSLSCPSEEGESCVANCVSNNVCMLTPWSIWSPCSATCDGGSQSRWRDVVGGDCGGAMLREVQTCGLDCCPVQCVLSAWSSWAACEPCEAGSAHRSRTVVSEAMCGAPPCSSELSEMTPCPVSTVGQCASASSTMPDGTGGTSVTSTEVVTSTQVVIGSTTDTAAPMGSTADSPRVTDLAGGQPIHQTASAPLLDVVAASAQQASAMFSSETSAHADASTMLLDSTIANNSDSTIAGTGAVVANVSENSAPLLTMVISIVCSLLGVLSIAAIIAFFVRRQRAKARAQSPPSEAVASHIYDDISNIRQAAICDYDSADSKLYS